MPRVLQYETGFSVGTLESVEIWHTHGMMSAHNNIILIKFLLDRTLPCP